MTTCLDCQICDWSKCTSKIWSEFDHVKHTFRDDYYMNYSWRHCDGMVVGFTTTGFDINSCSIAWGKWKRHPTCPIGQVKMILWYVQFLKSKMINIELFSVGSRGEFYLNIVSYASCILRHFVLFCWLRNSPFSNKDRVIYISQSWMPN